MTTDCTSPSENVHFVNINERVYASDSDSNSDDGWAKDGGTDVKGGNSNGSDGANGSNGSSQNEAAGADVISGTSGAPVEQSYSAPISDVTASEEARGGADVNSGGDDNNRGGGMGADASWTQVLQISLSTFAPSRRLSTCLNCLLKHGR